VLTHIYKYPDFQSSEISLSDLKIYPDFQSSDNPLSELKIFIYIYMYVYAYFPFMHIFHISLFHF